MYKIAKKFSFSASHQLRDLDEGHPCMQLHGHNYEVELIIGRDWLGMKTGFVLDYHELASFKDFIDKNLDHKHLNDVEVLKHLQPSAENIAYMLYHEAKNLYSASVHVLAVRVSETPKTWAEYSQ